MDGLLVAWAWVYFVTGPFPWGSHSGPDKRADQCRRQPNINQQPETQTSPLRRSPSCEAWINFNFIMCACTILTNYHSSGWMDGWGRGEGVTVQNSHCLRHIGTKQVPQFLFSSTAFHRNISIEVTIPWEWQRLTVCPRGLRCLRRSQTDGCSSGWTWP